MAFCALDARPPQARLTAGLLPFNHPPLDLPAYASLSSSMDLAIEADLPAKTRKFGKPARRSMILAMQRVLFAQVLDPNVDPARKAQCATAYERLEERMRILKGDPLPGSLRPESKRKAKQAANVTPIARVNDAVDKPAA